MAKLYFKYGTMKSGKSLELLRIKDTYERQGKKVIVLTPSVDDRNGVGVVSSRMGHDTPAYPIQTTHDIYQSMRVVTNPDCILVDEVQFLSKELVFELKRISEYLDIPVIGFGLKNDFSNQLFEGAQAMLIYAESIEEVKSTCTYCGRKATMNLRRVGGNPVYSGEQIQVGDEEYEPVCFLHYDEPVVDIED